MLISLLASLSPLARHVMRRKNPRPFIRQRLCLLDYLFEKIDADASLLHDIHKERQVRFAKGQFEIGAVIGLHRFLAEEKDI